MANHFYDLDLWKNGEQLTLVVYQLTARYPVEEKYCLVSDTRRSANSIIANIAESHGRFHYADKIRVLYIARGEIEETQSHLRIAHRLEYFTDAEWQSIDIEYEGLNRGLNKYINYLSSQR